MKLLLILIYFIVFYFWLKYMLKVAPEIKENDKESIKIGNLFVTKEGKLLNKSQKNKKNGI